MRGSVVLIAVLLAGAAVAMLGRILGPLVFAVFAFFLIQPVGDRLTAIGVPRWLAYLGIVTGIFTAVTALAVVVTANAEELRKHLDSYQERLYQRITEISPEAAATTRQTVHGVLERWGSHAIWTLYEAVEFSLMVFFYLLFIAANAGYLPGRVRRAFPDHAERILETGQTIASGMQRYISVKTFVGLGMGATVAVVLAVANVDYWPLWAFLFFLLNYITYIGSIVACVPPIALAFLQFDPATASMIAVALVLVRLFWIDYVELRLSGAELNTDPVLLLLGLAFWGQFWGVVGLVLAVPIITSLKLILLSVDVTRRWGHLASEK